MDGPRPGLVIPRDEERASKKGTIPGMGAVGGKESSKRGAVTASLGSQYLSTCLVPRNAPTLGHNAPGRCPVLSSTLTRAFRTYIQQSHCHCWNTSTTPPSKEEQVIVNAPHTPRLFYKPARETKLGGLIPTAARDRPVGLFQGTSSTHRHLSGFDIKLAHMSWVSTRPRLIDL